MRLMMAADGKSGMLTCVYCGAESESKQPYPVVYCHCRSVALEPSVEPERLRRAA
jgi:hypothetical protein